MTTISTDETRSMIASDKVEGTAVFNRGGERLGTVSRFMVDKRSGKVDYAVLSFGGLFGLGRDHYPLPWNVLTYDTRRGGYVVDLDPKVLENAPRYAEEREPAFDDRYGREVYTYYGIAWPY
ncbi:sporulation protein YlmC with PRC-barrel domain [Sphingomonas zeicaulis]|uniref:PRC-barrel domain-containing protein n=1 Tax=Sphingomonas zeicaulis TaxID=1632740 RepID=UPI003D1DB4FC